MTDAYSRLYHRFPREFPDVYGDDAAMASWVRLLMLADASWPMRPPIPRSCRPKALRLLVEAGLVLVEGEAYTVRGLDAERTRRSDAGRNAAAMRWQSAGNAEALPSKDETRRDEKEIPPPPAERGRRVDGTNPRARGSAPRQAGSSPRQNGASPRQEREAQKRAGMPQSVPEILRRAAAGGEA